MSSIELRMSNSFVMSFADGGTLPCLERIAAEIRFLTELERCLAGADEVTRTYRAWVDASESQANELSTGVAALAVQWPGAYQKAVAAGMRGVYGLEEAEFVVKLDRSAAAA